MSDYDGMKCGCGLPMSVNPHPEAGDPKSVCSVGALMVCIPCTIKSLKLSSDSNWELRRKVHSLVDALRELHDFGTLSEDRHKERSQQAFDKAAHLLNQFEVQ